MRSTFIRRLALVAAGVLVAGTAALTPVPAQAADATVAVQGPTEVLLGSADEQKPAADGTVEAWGRAANNPVKGWYGLKKGLRGRFGMYLPPVLEALGLAEVEHNPKNNRMRAK